MRKNQLSEPPVRTLRGIKSYVDQNIDQYEAAMKKFEDKMKDKLADDRKAEGLKQFLAGIVYILNRDWLLSKKRYSG